MKLSKAEKIVAAVLYEGYILYPYRASAVKNRHRFNFGTLLPRAYSEMQTGTESWKLHTECLVTGEGPECEIRVRFLHPLLREVGRLTTPCDELPSAGVPEYEPVDSLECAEELYQSWQEVVEREVSITRFSAAGGEPHKSTVNFPVTESVEALRETDGKIVGVIVRRQRAIDVGVEIQPEQIDDDVFKVCITVSNQTEVPATLETSREDATLQSLASAHVILGADEGQFVSLLDPPQHLVEAVAACRNEGCWPVLVGDAGDTDLMLASPIILYDYPQIAPESEGDFFDGTEIDEMLALRVMTLTDDEKRAMRSVDERARRILERTEAMPDGSLEQLHGIMRSPPSMQETQLKEIVP